MTRAEVEMLLDWHAWASERLLAAASGVGPGRFAANGPGSIPSPRDALVRLANHDATWLARWRGAPASFALFPGAMRGTQALAGRWTPIREETRAVLLALPAEAFGEPWEYRTRSGRTIRTTRALSVLHFVTRAAYLRAVAVTALREAGSRGVHVDLAAYLEARQRERP
ncbi:MAG: DinB family protein [Acidobacteriota bacterium]